MACWSIYLHMHIYVVQPHFLSLLVISACICLNSFMGLETDCFGKAGLIEKKHMRVR